MVRSVVAQRYIDRRQQNRKDGEHGKGDLGMNRVGNRDSVIDHARQVRGHRF